jgi:H+/Cl- antiporter ClcA
MGFVAVFGAAANTPIAATLMGIELFGAESGVFICIACVMSYLFSGHNGIYRAQRISLSKYYLMGIKDRTVVEKSRNQQEK